MRGKKVLSLAMAAVLSMGLFAGCGGSAENTAKESSAVGNEVVESSVQATEVPAPTEAPAETPVETPTEEPAATDNVMTALELAKIMGNGINLGNTMEAYGHTSLGVGQDTSTYETLWGSPVTTQEMITGMKEAGFDSLRIPVAWTNAMNFEAGDYTIGQDYLDRVEEIINYALNEDMYVIVNDHWDGGWWGMFGSATQETRDQAMELYVSMWSQIAEEYKDYDEHLIFESGNEELGYRLNDTDIAKDSGALSDDECFEMTNRINQAFVDTIRSAGGHNADRFLLIAGFGTDINNTVDDRFVMPTDTIDDKLLISVHYYDPSGYCIFTSVDTWGTKEEYEYMNAQLAKMTKFTEQGIGVVIGEYGVLMEQVELKENAESYVENFLDNCDLYGYVPMLWDCSNLFDRREIKIVDEEMKAIYQEHKYANQVQIPEEELKAAAQADMDVALANASDGFVLSEDKAVAWIMYNSSDWGTLYSVGDVYDPASKTGGVVATDVEITGEGEYTVALDFTGTAAGYANSVVFSALAIGNGELLYPGYIINITEVLINGEPYKLLGRPYTSSDDQKCTRVNLYNEWVSALPEEIRVLGGGTTGCSPCLLDPATLGNVETIQVTFKYMPGN